MPLPEPELLDAKLSRVIAALEDHLLTLGFSKAEVKEMRAKAERDAAFTEVNP